jgi:hypothetical protein
MNSFPGTGSFTRPSDKVHVGQTLLEVLKDRYVDEEKSATELYLGHSKIKVDVYDFDRVKATQKYGSSIAYTFLAKMLWFNC